MRGLILAAAAAAGLMTAGAASAATMLDLGVAGGFALVDLASGKTLDMHSGPIAGPVLLGNHVNAAFSGGGGGRISGVLDYDSTVTGTGSFGQLMAAPTTATVSTGFTTSAFDAANGVASYIEGLAPTQTFGTISSKITINGNGGLNVIRLGDLRDALLTLHGGANDVFVFDVSGSFVTNRAMALTGGLTADHVIFDFTGASGDVLQTSGGDQLYGTFLATHGGSFQFANLELTGSLINTGGDVQFASGSQISTFDGFKPPIPEPGDWTLMILGMGAVGLQLRRRRAHDLRSAVAA